MGPEDPSRDGSVHEASPGRLQSHTERWVEEGKVLTIEQAGGIQRFSFLFFFFPN